MSAHLPLNEMRWKTNFKAMEALWEDFSREADRIDSLNWHQVPLKKP